MSLPRRLALAGVAMVAMVVTAAAPALAAPAAGPIRSAGGATAVADSYIVVFKDSVVSGATVEARAGDLIKRHGGEVARTWTAALRGFEIRAGERVAARIAAHPSVAWVEQNHTVSIMSGTQSPTPSWGLDRVDQRSLPLDNSYTYPNTASNVHAYIISTGIRTTHSDFGGRATWGTNTTGDGIDTDCNGHGTHVAGTVGGTAYGVAKGVSLVAVKVFNCQGSGTYAGLYSGIDWVTGNAVKPAVAHLGFAITPPNTTMESLVAGSIASGITYAVAAGDSNADACLYSPARVPPAITVGATQSNDARAPYSNYGTCLDLFAPGSSITAPWITSDSTTNTIHGTSMAAAHVTGAAALVLSANPWYTPQQVRDYLVNNATNGVVTDPGPGSPNKLLYIVNNTCTSPGQKLGNPGFESGDTAWSATSGVIGRRAEPAPRSGNWNAWLNGYGTTTINTLTQSVTLPSGCASHTLSFWLHIKTAETTTTIAYDTLRVQILNSSGTVLATLGTYSNLNASTGYIHRSFNLSAYAGQSIQIRFHGQEDSILQTSFIIDDTSLNVS